MPAVGLLAVSKIMTTVGGFTGPLPGRSAQIPNILFALPMGDCRQRLRKVLYAIMPFAYIFRVKCVSCSVFQVFCSAIVCPQITSQVGCDLHNNAKCLSKCPRNVQTKSNVILYASERLPIVHVCQNFAIAEARVQVGYILCLHGNEGLLLCHGQL